MKKSDNYHYLIELHSSIDEYLSSSTPNHDKLQTIVVSFCIVTEKIFKIQLYKKNPLLVYNYKKLKEDDAFITIINKKERNVETISIGQLIERYSLLFDERFSGEEMQIIRDLFNIRNHFIHSHQPDNYHLNNADIIITKMGTVWSQISSQSKEIFGNSLIKVKKPKKTYSDSQLKELLKNEVKKKIEKKGNFDEIWSHVVLTEEYPAFGIGKSERCPRCGKYGFEKEPFNTITTCATGSYYFNDFKNYNSDGLYKCKSCNLELTKKEFEIAKEIKSNLENCT